MPNIKSAKKRVSVIERRKDENRYVKSTMATMIKNYKAAVNSDTAKAEAMLKDVISYIGSAQSKGIIHANNASRKISRLNLMLNKAKNNVKPEEVKVEVKTEEVKPAKVAPVAKKPVAKKPVEKKAPAKKVSKKAE